MLHLHHVLKTLEMASLWHDTNVSCERSTYMVNSVTVMFPFGRDAAFSVIKTVSNSVQLVSINIKIKGEST